MAKEEKQTDQEEARQMTAAELKVAKLDAKENVADLSVAEQTLRLTLRVFGGRRG